MTTYYRLYLGKQNAFVKECYEGGFIGADFGLHVDLTGQLPDSFQEFNVRFIPVLQQLEPSRNNRSAGLACGMLWTVAKYMDRELIKLVDGQEIAKWFEENKDS